MSGRQRPATVGGVPYVDLLPPEIGQRTRDRSILSWALLGMVIVIALIAAGIAVAALRSTTAQAALSTAQSQGLLILAQQQEYSEIREVNDLIVMATLAEGAALSTEINWTQLLFQIAPLVPEGSQIRAFGAMAPSPWVPVVVPSGVLRPPLIGNMSMTIRSTSIQTISSIADQIEELDFVSGVTLVTIANDGAYDGVMTIDLNELAFSDRAVPAEGDSE